MNLSLYLSRISYTGPLTPDAALLRSLQRAHLHHVPFENLDIHLGRPIHLEEEALFNKIVTRRRGGFCYELNYLFARLLEDLGYNVLLLSASSANDDGSYLPEFDHLILQVNSPDDPQTLYLVDVGWGDGPLEPLRLLEMGDQARGQGGRVFRLAPETGYLVLEEMKADGDWLKHYRFDLRGHEFAEFFPMCRYHSISPDSMFTQKRLCSLYIPGGRVTLTELRLIKTEINGLRGNWPRTERELGPEEIPQALRDVFGISLGF